MATIQMLYILMEEMEPTDKIVSSPLTHSTFDLPLSGQLVCWKRLSRKAASIWIISYIWLMCVCLCVWCSRSWVWSCPTCWAELRNSPSSSPMGPRRRHMACPFSSPSLDTLNASMSVTYTLKPPVSLFSSALVPNLGVLTLTRGHQSFMGESQGFLDFNKT